MSTEKCPYCYRPLSTHTHDPILLPNGSKYKWNSDTELIEVPNILDRIYKGIYQINENDVIELQDELKTLEEENLPVIDRTTFSPLNSGGKFQITGKHIKEMRDSVEKLLNEFGLTKTDFFNYDEDNNHIIHPNGDKVEWTDPIAVSTDLQKFQVKAIHVEDLRHSLTSIRDWVETFSGSFIGSTSISGEFSGAGTWQDLNRDDKSFIIGDHNWNGNSSCYSGYYIRHAAGEIGKGTGQSVINFLNGNLNYSLESFAQRYQVSGPDSRITHGYSGVGLHFTCAPTRWNKITVDTQLIIGGNYSFQILIKGELREYAPGTYSLSADDGFHFSWMQTFPVPPWTGWFPYCESYAPYNPPFPSWASDSDVLEGNLQVGPIRITKCRDF